jgi:hypothetical protein
MEGYSSVFNLFSIGFADATAVTNLYSAPTEHYLFGEEYYPFTHRPEMVDFHNLSNTNLNSRFEQMINTFWLASLAPEASTETSRRISVYCCPERRGIRCIETTSLSQLTERTQQSLIWKKSTTAIAGGSAHSSFPACSFS